jgi:lipopolysaccharide/colanic/teichoic acid biosynthesis glycosyltransferase
MSARINIQELYAPLWTDKVTLTPDLWSPGRPWYLPSKGVIDFIAGLALLGVTAPVMLISALLVKLTSSGPAFYSQTRTGKNGRHFTIYKLRTMYHDCESVSGPRWSTPGDSRITPLGRLLRRTHIDELPQLWNVVRGDMALVGPRPERPEFIPSLSRALPHYSERLLVRPGITGLAQVQLPPDTDLDSVRHKLAYDLYYVHHVSLWLDVRILTGTLLYLLRLPLQVCLLPQPPLVEQTCPTGTGQKGAAALVPPA